VILCPCVLIETVVIHMYTTISSKFVLSWNDAIEVKKGAYVNPPPRLATSMILLYDWTPAGDSFLLLN
jgi:hypothetical protein